MRADRNDGMSSCEAQPATPGPDRRRPWRPPAVAILNAYDAETGVNSSTDINATFS